MNSTYHTTYQYHFCLGENLLRGDGAQSCLSVCHQSSLSSPLSSPLLYWLRHQCWQIIQSGDDAAFRQNVIFPNNCANKPSLSALSCSLQPDPSNQVMWLTSPTIYRHVSVRIIFRKSAVYTGSAWCAVSPHSRNLRGNLSHYCAPIVVFKTLCCSSCQSDLGWQLQDTGTR